MELSLWEKRSLLKADVIIVGAGITGLSVAAALTEGDDSLDIIVLERGLLPTGASTRNAGFACFGSLTELLSDSYSMGEDKMLELVEMRWKGLNRLKSRLGEERIGFEPKGGFELLNSQNDSALHKLDAINSSLNDIFKSVVYRLQPNLQNTFGFEGFSHVVQNQFEGQLDTGKLMYGLWKYCAERGVRIITGATVLNYNAQPSSIEVNTTDYSFQCKSLALCTNAFSKELFNVELVPGRGIVLVAEPTRPLQFQGSFHYDEGYYYFRDFNRKIIFGGGRNRDLAGEETSSFELNQKILAHLKEELTKKIIPKTDFTIEDSWAGIMAFGDTKWPIIKEIAPGIVAGVRLGGMGVAIGSQVGHTLSQMILERL